MSTRKSQALMWNLILFSRGLLILPILMGHTTWKILNSVMRRIYFRSRLWTPHLKIGPYSNEEIIPQTITRSHTHTKEDHFSEKVNSKLQWFSSRHPPPGYHSEIHERRWLLNKSLGEYFGSEAYISQQVDTASMYLNTLSNVSIFLSQ